MATKDDKSLPRIVGRFLELHTLWLREPFQDQSLTPIERSMGELIERMTPDQVHLCGELISDGRKARTEASGQSREVGARRARETGQNPGFWRRLWNELLR